MPPFLVCLKSPAERPSGFESQLRHMLLRAIGRECQRTSCRHAPLAACHLGPLVARFYAHYAIVDYVHARSLNPRRSAYPWPHPTGPSKVAGQQLAISFMARCVDSCDEAR